LYAVATEGYGAMPSYEAQISPRDRWAIVAFIRALQLSQHFPEGQLTPEMRSEMAQARVAKEGR
jgi:mono/diheme cytochrome c family protein